MLVSNDYDELKLNNNPGVLTGRLPGDTFAELKRDVAAAIEANVNTAHNLVGMIEELYEIRLGSKIIDYLTGMAVDYQSRFKYRQRHDVKFTSSWINVQKKHEYSPVHHHPRTLGWVIWVKIPYDIEDEMNMPNSVNSKVKKNSNFEFVYSNLGGELQTHSISVDQSYEGVVMMFPSYLRHAVYPFYTSNESRISVAGNIELLSINR